MIRRGWCPGALRPMPAGDGLLLRIRPHGGRLSQSQVALIADLASEYGNGQIDLGSRANLQLRGVREARLPELQAALAEADLLDGDQAAEARRNIILTPFEAEGALGSDLLTALETGLRRGPDLPAKFGFAIDTGPFSALQDASADLRLEQSPEGLILRADGMERGEAVKPQTAARRALQIADWFSRQSGARRMRDLVARGQLPPLRQEIAKPDPVPPAVFLRRAPFLFAAFGASTAAALAGLDTGLRLTPWRAVLPEGLPKRVTADWLRDPASPVLRISACTGAPGCSAASVATRDLARALAPLLPKEGAQIHISGCARGCAHPGPAALTLTGREGCFDLIENAKASDPARRQGLEAHEITELIRGPYAAQL